MKRTLLLLTDKQLHAVRNASRYVIESAEFSDYDGDHNEADARRYQRGLDALVGTDVDIDKLIVALNDVMSAAAGNSCSCVDLVGKPHRRDCYLSTSRHHLDRLEALKKILLEARK